MKILWFCNTPAAGAANLPDKFVGGGWLATLDEALQEHVELHVAFHYPKPMFAFKYGRTMYYPIPSGKFYWNLVMSFLWPQRKLAEHESAYLRYINMIEPDLIHIHGTEGPYISILSNIKTPTVVSIQGILTVYHHKFLSGIERKSLKTLNTSRSLRSILRGVRPYDRAYKSIGRGAKLEQKYLAYCQNIIGRTDWDKRVSRVLAPNSKYYYGGEILRDVFYDNKWGRERGDTLRIHSTSTDKFYKGFEVICQSALLLESLGLTFRWQVAGIQDSDLIVRVVRKMMGETYPAEKIMLLGKLTDLQLAEAMLQADLYVMASHIENSPNSLCEAMALGLPCISSFAGGAGSLLKDGEEGILIQDGDPWALVGAVLELHRDKEKAIKYGKQARMTAISNHSREAVVDQYLGIYKMVLKDYEKHLR